jgi:hypothetical protein
MYFIVLQQFPSLCNAPTLYTHLLQFIIIAFFTLEGERPIKAAEGGLGADDRRM